MQLVATALPRLAEAPRGSLRTGRRRFANAAYDGRLATAVKPLVMDGDIAAAV